MAKRETLIKKLVDEDSRAVHFVPAVDGMDADADRIVVNLADMQPDIINRLALHGLSQKLGDSYSQAKDSAPDEIGRARWCLSQVGEIVARLVAGDWQAARAVGERGSPILIEALHRFMERAGDPKSLDECKAKLDSLTTEQKSALRKGALADVYAEIQSERATARAEAARAAGADPTALFADGDDDDTAE